MQLPALESMMNDRKNAARVLAEAILEADMLAARKALVLVEHLPFGAASVFVRRTAERLAESHLRFCDTGVSRRRINAACALRERLRSRLEQLMAGEQAAETAHALVTKERAGATSAR